MEEWNGIFVLLLALIYERDLTLVLLFVRFPSFLIRMWVALLCFFNFKKDNKEKPSTDIAYLANLHSLILQPGGASPLRYSL